MTEGKDSMACSTDTDGPHAGSKLSFEIALATAVLLKNESHHDTAWKRFVQARDKASRLLHQLEEGDAYLPALQAAVAYIDTQIDLQAQGVRAVLKSLPADTTREALDEHAGRLKGMLETAYYRATRFPDEPDRWLPEDEVKRLLRLALRASYEVYAGEPMGSEREKLLRDLIGTAIVARHIYGKSITDDEMIEIIKDEMCEAILAEVAKRVERREGRRRAQFFYEEPASPEELVTPEEELDEIISDALIGRYGLAEQHHTTFAVMLCLLTPTASLDHRKDSSSYHYRHAIRTSFGNMLAKYKEWLTPSRVVVANFDLGRFLVSLYAVLCHAMVMIAGEAWHEDFERGLTDRASQRRLDGRPTILTLYASGGLGHFGGRFSTVYSNTPFSAWMKYVRSAEYPAPSHLMENSPRIALAVTDPERFLQSQGRSPQELLAEVQE